MTYNGCSHSIWAALLPGFFKRRLITASVAFAKYGWTGLESPPTQKTSDRERCLRPDATAKACLAKTGTSVHFSITVCRKPDSSTDSSLRALLEKWSLEQRDGEPTRRE